MLINGKHYGPPVRVNVAKRYRVNRIYDRQLKRFSREFHRLQAIFQMAKNSDAIERRARIKTKLNGLNRVFLYTAKRANEGSEP